MLHLKNFVLQLNQRKVNHDIEIMKKFLTIFLIALSGCTTSVNQIDAIKLEKAAKLADQIEMNDYKLVATNGTLLLIKQNY